MGAVQNQMTKLTENCREIKKKQLFLYGIGSIQFQYFFCRCRCWQLPSWSLFICVYGGAVRTVTHYAYGVCWVWKYAYNVFPNYNYEYETLCSTYAEVKAII